MHLQEQEGLHCCFDIFVMSLSKHYAPVCLHIDNHIPHPTHILDTFSALHDRTLQTAVPVRHNSTHLHRIKSLTNVQK